MNQETEEKLNQTLDWIGETASQGKDFVLEQAPLYAQELIRYEIISSLIFCSLFLVAGVVGLVLLFKSMKEQCPGEVDRFYLGMGAMSVIPFSLFGTLETGMDAIKAYTAPRVVIVEHLRDCL